MRSIVRAAAIATSVALSARAQPVAPVVYRVSFPAPEHRFAVDRSRWHVAAVVTLTSVVHTALGVVQQVICPDASSHPITTAPVAACDRSTARNGTATRAQV